PKNQEMQPAVVDLDLVNKNDRLFECHVSDNTSEDPIGWSGDIFGSGDEIVWKGMEIEYDMLTGFEQFENEEVQPAIVDLDIVSEKERLPECEEGFINRGHISGTANIDEATLNAGDAFENWNEVDSIVNKYAKQNGFVAVKCRKNLDPIDHAIVRRRSYNCWKSGISKPKKVEDITSHRNSGSIKTNCPWQVSFYFGKQSTTIHLTKIKNSHNHQCDQRIIELAPKNTRFSSSMLDKIEHYTINGHLNARQQYDLLLKDFPQHHIKKKNLYNAIQKFRGVQIHDESNAAKMLSYLIEQRNKDPDYVVITRLEGHIMNSLDCSG
ncbi:12987_t:CDS:1, partial [Gigaspora margarita]